MRSVFLPGMLALMVMVTLPGAAEDKAPGKAPEKVVPADGKAVILKTGDLLKLEDGVVVRTRTFEMWELLEIYQPGKGSIASLSLTEDATTVDQWPNSPYFVTVQENKRRGLITISVSREVSKGEFKRWRITRLEREKYEVKAE